jgi:hypothetical protein
MCFVFKPLVTMQCQLDYIACHVLSFLEYQFNYNKTSEFVSASEVTFYILARIKMFLVKCYIEKVITCLYLLRSVVFAFKRMENISLFDRTNFI